MTSDNVHTTTAITALTWIASDAAMMGRFAALTGIAPGDIRTAAQSPGFLSGVLEFITAHEPTLMAFCADCDLDPAQVRAAGLVLSGGPVPGPGDFA